MLRILKRHVWLASVVLIAALLTTTYLLSRMRDFPYPIFESAEDGVVGERGPLVLNFRQPMARGSVESSWGLSPAVTGYFEWLGDKLYFWPKVGFNPQKTFVLSLKAGATNQQGRVLKRELTWTFSIRQPQVVYLGNPNTAAEVWRISLDGQQKWPLTSSGGRVFDFAPAPDGNHIVFSFWNDQGGTDLGIVDRNGKQQRILVSCGSERCFQPAWTPDSRRLFFTRLTHDSQGGGMRSEIWFYDFDASSPDLFLGGPDLDVNSPIWSPDGDYLAVYDSRAKAVRILPRLGGETAVIPTTVQQRVHWSSDSRRVYFVVEASDGLFPYHEVFVADLDSRSTDHLMTDEHALWDTSLPIESPDGSLLMVSRRALDGPVGKQLWLMPVGEKGETKQITTEAVFSYAAYQWEPAGRAVVFQRIDLSRSDALPQIALWWREEGDLQILVEDAALPDWLP